MGKRRSEIKNPLKVVDPYSALHKFHVKMYDLKHRNISADVWLKEWKLSYR